MNSRCVGWLLVTLVWLFHSNCAIRAQEAAPLSLEQQQMLEAGMRQLQTSLDEMQQRQVDDVADARIFLKGLTWALRYDREFTSKDVLLLQRALERGSERAGALASGKPAWRNRSGKTVLGYVSQIDDSVQPYGLIVPRDYDSATPIRLDVVLHGSTRPVGLSELRFLSRFDEGDAPNSAPPSQAFIELHPLGRVENCYRWSGEADVFEAIEDACRRFNIDRRRIVLRGMSMGASGTWHLGLKHPDRFVALGPYCGYVDTHRFSETLPNFVKVGPLPEHQELGLHMLDSIDYAANAGVVPAIACMGEKDVFFQAHVLMEQSLQREGLTMINLISPGTGHVIDPVTHAEQMRRIGEHALQGLDQCPRNIRFVTWTLKYSRCHWLQILGLEQHYARAEVSARLCDDGIEITDIKNITRLEILTRQMPVTPTWLKIGAATLTVPPMNADSAGFVVIRRGDIWAIAGDSGQVALDGKRPGLQGPIDDAFTAPFVCVRGTGRPWNTGVQAYVDASLKRFADEWHHYFRGQLPVKDDTAVTDEDVRTRNLILFGDPGSNSWIAKVMPQLPLSWSRESLRFGEQEYSAKDHMVAMIAPNPLPGATGRYVVLNSGHTFREAELAKFNYLLFPRWGDWAVLKLAPAEPDSAGPTEEVVHAGYFDEFWRRPE